jgi:transposase
MEYGAIDLHKKESQIRIITERGETVDRRIATTRERFTALFEGRRPMRILLEASTESEWVAQHLETLGHEVIVADPSFAPMYSERSRRIKTDRRDVVALAEACQRGCYRAAHRRSASQRTVQVHLNVRRELTDSRTRAISLARAVIRGAGLRMRSGSTGSFLVRMAALDLPASVSETLGPLQRLITVLNDELATADDRMASIATQDPLAGLKLIGFAIWERRGAGGRNVTFPARQYAVNGERRSFALLRPIADTTAQHAVRDRILEAYAAYEQTLAADA